MERGNIYVIVTRSARLAILVYLANGAIFAPRNEDVIIEFVRCTPLSLCATISCERHLCPP